MSKNKIDINSAFDELFEEFKTELKIPDRQKLSEERRKQLENEYCEAVYGRDFVVWREQRYRKRREMYHCQHHEIKCACGEKYILYIEPETIDPASFLGYSEDYYKTRTAEYNDFWCIKCGRIFKYIGKLKQIANERGNFNME